MKTVREEVLSSRAGAPSPPGLGAAQQLALKEGFLHGLLPGSDVTPGEALAFPWRDLQTRQRERGARASGEARPPRPGSGPLCQHG